MRVFWFCFGRYEVELALTWNRPRFSLRQSREQVERTWSKHPEECYPKYDWRWIGGPLQIIRYHMPARWAGCATSERHHWRGMLL